MIKYVLIPIFVVITLFTTGLVENSFSVELRDLKTIISNDEATKEYAVIPNQELLVIPLTDINSIAYYQLNTFDQSYTFQNVTVLEGVVYEDKKSNNDNGATSGDLDCSDVAARNFLVGSSDSYNFDRDGDGIGCESSNYYNDYNSLYAVTSDNNSRCPDGFHRSPSGDCERVTDTSGMERCPDGFHRSPSGDCERVTDNNDNDKGSNPCTPIEASKDHTCTSGSEGIDYSKPNNNDNDASNNDYDNIDNWTDPPAEETTEGNGVENEESGQQENNENTEEQPNNDEGSSSSDEGSSSSDEGSSSSDEGSSDNN
ncbi:hypothetical protein [Candidatus Nitrosocosmicus arcticus]|nr:hypothetical protein [Candidatus Nitrosocosmicus arcticus]